MTRIHKQVYSRGEGSEVSLICFSEGEARKNHSTGFFRRGWDKRKGEQLEVYYTSERKRWKRSELRLCQEDYLDLRDTYEVTLIGYGQPIMK